MKYELKVGGVTRQLPIVPISDELAIASFVILGDCELVTAVAPLLAERLPEVDYLVTAEVREKGVWKPLLARAVFSPGCYRPDAEETVPVTCVFAAAELGPASKEDLRFSVVPRDSFGRAGKALQS